MSKILVLYYSRHGSVSALAHEVAVGVESVAGAEATLRTVPPVSTVAESTEPSIPEHGDIYVSAEDLQTCSGLILGSPCRFGTMAAPLKYFFDQHTSDWLNGTLKDKAAAVFTSSSSHNGGQESTLLGMMLPLIHHGMVLIGIPFAGTTLGQTDGGGSPYGAGHIDGQGSPLTESEKAFAHVLGRRVANCAIQIGGSSL
ncbi:MAG: NAD(P)H:quinone oxidoreductase [Pseudomonadota bacterium]